MKTMVSARRGTQRTREREEGAEEPRGWPGSCNLPGGTCPPRPLPGRSKEPAARNLVPSRWRKEGTGGDSGHLVVSLAQGVPVQKPEVSDMRGGGWGEGLNPQQRGSWRVGGGDLPVQGCVLQSLVWLWGP